MQKSNQWIGIALLGAALVLMAWQSQEQAKRVKAEAAAQPAAATPATVATNTTPALATATATPASSPKVKAIEKLSEERLYTLENELVKIVLTSRGGAVRSVTLKEYPEKMGSATPYTMTAPEALPYLALSLTGQAADVDLANYNLVAQGPQSVTLARQVAQGLTLERRYTLTTPEKGKKNALGYLLNQELVWRSSSTSDLQLGSYSMNVGTASPELSDKENLFLNFAYSDTKEARFIDLRHFLGGGFLWWNHPATESFSATTPTPWAAVKNKFFTLATTPKVPAVGVQAHPIMVGTSEHPHQTLAGSLLLGGPLVKAGAATTVELSTYMGPKEYGRLAAIGGGQDEIMQWGWPIFSFFSKLFISMLNWLAGVAHNYGVAIILLTLIIRAAMWPFTAAAAKASKKMAAVQPMLKEIQEKYKNNPEKLQRETLKIFQENQVNPLAGCLPALLQIPVFIGFFYMLRSAAELRFEPFLWVKDLSMPDTVAVWGGFPVNPLPILMLITMYYQIKLTPSSGDPQQQKIMQFTPFLFSFLLYNFSAGLTLYWTLSNVVSIIQQILVNREQEPPKQNGTGGEVIDIKTATVKN